MEGSNGLALHGGGNESMKVLIGSLGSHSEVVMYSNLNWGHILDDHLVIYLMQ